MESYVLCFQIFETSDLPGGVVNILSGARDHVTKYLAEHQNVDALWYFGSEVGCKFVEAASAVNVKRTWVDWGRGRDWGEAEQAWVYILLNVGFGGVGQYQTPYLDVKVI